MIRNLSYALSGLAIAGFALAGLPAAQAGDDIVIRLAGGGSWSVDCDYETSRGKDRSARDKGRGSMSTGSVVLRDMISATCEVKTRRNAYVVLSADTMGGDSACPFEMMGDDEEGCAIRIGENAEVNVKLKGGGETAG